MTRSRFGSPAKNLLLFGSAFFLGFTAFTEPTQFILFNVGANTAPEALRAIHQEFAPPTNVRVCVGASAIFSYLDKPREQTRRELDRFLKTAQQNSIPVVVQLDGENWWRARPDLWNWWDSWRPGYSPTNRLNVEWTNWSPDAAIKIAWRNWGNQIRVLPPPNLMSPGYRQACHQEMRLVIPLVLNWWQALPADKKYLFIGIKLGWESSVGINAWYYPNGNALLNLPVNQDPSGGLKVDELPARGVAQIGYAAVKTAGLRTSGDITEADLAEVVRRHLADLCSLAGELGVPRERLFTHVAGWKEQERLYSAGVNSFSCPGWSFYRHANDPKQDIGFQKALQCSDAPYWAAVEWLYQGPRQTGLWQQALNNTLVPSNCRYLCIFNWENVSNSMAILQAVHQVVQTARLR